MRAALRWAAFPAFVLIPTAVGIWMIHSGWGHRFTDDPQLAELLVYFVVVTPTTGAVWALEWIIPLRKEWNYSQGDIRTDMLHMSTGFLVQSVERLLIVGVGATLAGMLSEALGSPVWPTSWALWVQLPLALLIGELGHYGYHRLAHETPLLWRLHATHHSPNRLYWLNANRFQWFDIAIMNFFQVAPLIALGMPTETFLLYGIFTIVFGYLQHSNIDYRLGWFNYVFSTPDLHRWHHSPVVEEGNTNYAGVLILWDQVFGTFYHPKERAYDRRPGNGMDTFPKGFIAQQLSPFRWKQLEAEARAALAKDAVGAHRDGSDPKAAGKPRVVA